MKKDIERDLVSASDALESLQIKYPKLSLGDRIDLGARLRAVGKNAEDLDKKIKADIKEQLHGKEGTVLGDVFKAVLSLISSTRFNQKLLQEDDPKTYKLYCEESEAARITFEAR